MIYHSINASSWSANVGPGVANLRAIAAGAGPFMAVGFSGEVRTSTAGVTWSGNLGTTSASLLSVHFDGTCFYVAGGGTLLRTKNGASWEGPLGSSLAGLRVITSLPL